jgi:hypothetical protein
MKMANMNVWETEDEYAAATHASLPTPTDTPYRTPSRTSRRSGRQKSVSPAPSSSPPPMPNGDSHSRRNSRDVTNDESISILDPRRFTPTLHANLVSEILALRRDQEEKTKIIEGLEINLHTSHSKNEDLASQLTVTAKKNRSLERQQALLEGGTSSALGELAKERDEAIDSVADLKRRLEAAQKKARSQDEESDKIHKLWAREKDTWGDERRKYERKLHAAEVRLKSFMEEVAAQHAAHQIHTAHGESQVDDMRRENGGAHGSDTASIRTMSLTNSIRFSVVPSKPNGVSLADELNFEDEEDLRNDHDGRESAMSFVSHRRTTSRDSMVSRSHLIHQSVDSLRRPGSVAQGRLMASQVTGKRQGGIFETDEETEKETTEDCSHLSALKAIHSVDRSLYVDAGVQYSPPPSPELKPTPVPEITNIENQIAAIDPIKQHTVGSEWEIEANQRRKRVRASAPLTIEPGMDGQAVSAGSQILDGPLSPPKTPKSPTRASPVPHSPVAKEMQTQATQTDFSELELPVEDAPHPPILIPSISIHPPTSRPATPRESRLPQYFKDVGCQVSMHVSVTTRNASVQTEEIRVAQRIALLPQHLQPSTITSCPPSPLLESPIDDDGYIPPIPVAVPPRNPRRMNSQQSVRETASSTPRAQSPETRDTYPGNNDDGPLAKNKGSIRRPPRVSSLFAGFSSDDGDDFGDADMSDNDFRTALSAPKPKSAIRGMAKRVSIPPTSVPEDVEPLDESSQQSKSPLRQPGNYVSSGLFKLPDAPHLPTPKPLSQPTVRQLDKPLTLASNYKQGIMRRAALISNGIAAHQVRSRSPSLPEAVKAPPFPIPTRASSRKPPFSVSVPSDGNRSPTRDSWGSHARRGSGRGHYRVNSIRKVRSAATMPANTHRPRRRGSRSPPCLSVSTEAPESPHQPPLPYDDITSPTIPGMSRFGTHRQQASTNTANTSVTGEAQSVSGTQATSVVDAISQTMVGEWMFKYVRRRKSFGVPDSGAVDGENGANGVRHKRWVWLAPYERAVMWSSKQPTSGSALMGKSGRKCKFIYLMNMHGS